MPYSAPRIDMSDYDVKTLNCGSTHFAALFSRRWIDDEECKVRGDGRL